MIWQGRQTAYLPPHFRLTSFFSDAIIRWPSVNKLLKSCRLVFQYDPTLSGSTALSWEDSRMTLPRHILLYKRQGQCQYHSHWNKYYYSNLYASTQPQHPIDQKLEQYLTGQDSTGRWNAYKMKLARYEKDEKNLGVLSKLIWTTVGPKFKEYLFNEHNPRKLLQILL